MSFAEDMGFDCFDPEDFDPIYKLEQGWNNGIHRTKKLEEIPLNKMLTSHLVFTIRYFSGIANVTPLLSELKKRKIAFTFYKNKLVIDPYKGACLRCGESAFAGDQLCMRCLNLFKAKSIKIWEANTSPDRYSWSKHQLDALAKKFYLIKFIGIDFYKYK